MTAKRNKESMPVTSQPSPAHASQNTDASNSNRTKRDILIPTKDKSPDDLEILD